MAKKKQVKLKSQQEMLLHIPNPMHLEACKKGGRIFRDKSKYTRKSKHKNKVDYNE